MDKSLVTGVILAGGQSRRMGQDKSFVEFDGRPMIQHVIERISPQVGALYINAPDTEAYRALGLSLVPDTTGDQVGPLAGLYVALRNCPTPWLACVTCDLPKLGPHLVEALLDAAEDAQVKLVFAQAGERAQPLVGVFHRDLAQSLAQYIDAGNHRVLDWIELHPHWVVDQPVDELVNINTQAELAAISV